MTSQFSQFYKKSLKERQKIIKEYSKLSAEESALLNKEGSLSLETANHMIENVIGTLSFPLGLATNFSINGRDYVVPMALEEPSVVAAASNAAKLSCGFKAVADESIMVGQIQLVNPENPQKAKETVDENKKQLMEKANSRDSTLINLGGGVKDIKVRVLETERGSMLIVELFVNVKDAMGANAVNSFCETIKEKLIELTNTKVRARIITNLCIARMVKAEATWKKEVIGEETIEAVLDAYAFAQADQFRATTHNKGIMNGIDAVALATGQDFRALEAAAHSYASLGKKYSPLTVYEKDSEGNLIGRIALPLAVGIIGGATKTNPVAQTALKILGIKSTQELAMVMACVGLANNFAALRVLSTEGIQKGHMKLHAQNIAVNAGAEKKQVDETAEKMIKDNNISVSHAKEILEGMK